MGAEQLRSKILLFCAQSQVYLVRFVIFWLEQSGVASGDWQFVQELPP